MVFCVLRQYNYFRVFSDCSVALPHPPNSNMHTAKISPIHLFISFHSLHKYPQYSKIIILPQHTKNHYKKLTSVLGEKRQILCITHLPQIAALADRHFLIEKHSEGDTTTTEVFPLEQEDSVDISPPEAIFANGFNASPALAEIRNSTLSLPSGPHSVFSSRRRDAFRTAAGNGKTCGRAD